MSTLVLLALTTLISEDLACITAGVLIAQGKLGFFGGTLACLTGILSGDLLLFLAGRWLGRPALQWPLLRRAVTPEQVDRASEWFARRGMAVVFISRFTPGLRLATYFAAGLLRTNLLSFALYFLAAAALWTPLLVGATVLFGGPAVDAFRSQQTAGFVAVVAILVVVSFGLRRLFAFSARRRMAGFLLRKVRWEFWPPWAAYVPLFPYLVWLAVKHRSLTLFTATNPGMPSGGFVGESKSQILEQLSPSGVVARYVVISAALSRKARLRVAQEFLGSCGLPVVLKPDVGERGSGVQIIRSNEQLQHHLQTASRDLILQQYIDGLEFGVFYQRYPDEPAGRVVSVTEKRFPFVIGDGRSSITELILRDRRAVCLLQTYRQNCLRQPAGVPAASEIVPLVEIGSHCRGALFLDGSQLKTSALEEAIDRVSKTHPGFYLGRFDVRSPSVQAFQQGVFRVIELNGVASEPTHIYDPAVSLLDAYRALFAQWRAAFEIGAINRKRGKPPMGVAELVRLILAPDKTSDRPIEFVLAKDREA